MTENTRAEELGQQDSTVEQEVTSNEVSTSEVTEKSPIEEVVSEQQRRNDDLNYKAMREAKREAEKERDEYASKIKALEQSRLEQSRLEQNQVKSDDIIDDDISKTRKELKELKSQWAAQQNQVRFTNIEQKLKEDFPDLEEVVNEANIDILKARDRNFARTINKTPIDPDELYHRAVAAYTLIKKCGIYVKDDHQKDRDRVAKNMLKPRPATASSSSPSEGLADFANFSNMNEEERRKAIFRVARERANS